MKVSINETTLTNIGAAIREKTGKTDLIAPGDMPAEIRGIVSGSGSDVEPIVLTGDCSYACSGILSSEYINNFGNTISTNDITKASYMFLNSPLKYIPFQINMDQNTSADCQYMFSNSNLEELPVLSKTKPLILDGMFYECKYLRSLPEDFGSDWDFTVMNSNTNNRNGSIFQRCYSLRTIPESFLNQFWNSATARNYQVYLYTFYNCYVLDEINGMGVSTGAITSNYMSSFITSTCRLKNFTFATNEDGTPKIAPWKSQILDFSTSGHTPSYSANYVLNYNSGITADKEVKNDATYQALKNDPDWFTTNLNYSRYNHDSAVATINSLPDTSATGSNTIKFKGIAGSLTDGGAINTLTEEEIAVATAKGWTVSLA